MGGSVIQFGSGDYGKDENSHAQTLSSPISFIPIKKMMTTTKVLSRRRVTIFNVAKNL